MFGYTERGLKRCWRKTLDRKDIANEFALYARERAKSLMEKREIALNMMRLAESLAQTADWYGSADKVYFSIERKRGSDSQKKAISMSSTASDHMIEIIQSTMVEELQKMQKELDK